MQPSCIGSSMVLLNGCSLEGPNSYAGKIVQVGKGQESKPKGMVGLQPREGVVMRMGTLSNVEFI